MFVWPSIISTWPKKYFQRFVLWMPRHLQSSTIAIFSAYPTSSKPTSRCSSSQLVKLNLFNYVLGLFRAKFNCNSAFKSLVFRWE